MDHIASYYEAERILSKGRNKNDRPVANNTRLIRRSDTTIALRLHGTDILTWDSSDHTVTVRTGGWETPTSRDRISDALGRSLYLHDGVLCTAERVEGCPTHMPIDGAVFSTATGMLVRHACLRPEPDPVTAAKHAKYLDKFDTQLPLAAAFGTVGEAIAAGVFKRPLSFLLRDHDDPADPKTRAALVATLNTKLPLYKWS